MNPYIELAAKGVAGAGVGAAAGLGYQYITSQSFRNSKGTVVKELVCSGAEKLGAFFAGFATRATISYLSNKGYINGYAAFTFPLIAVGAILPVAIDSIYKANSEKNFANAHINYKNPFLEVFMKAITCGTFAAGLISQATFSAAR